MQVNVGRVVMVIGYDSVPKDYLGRFGIVTAKRLDGNWTVKFQQGLRGMGSLSHTVLENELQVVGEANYWRLD